MQFYLGFDANSTMNEMNLDLKPEDKNKITLYSNNGTLNTSEYKIIYENTLENYQPNLQKAQHKEGTMLFHIFFSKEYIKYDYIGFGKHYTKLTNKLVSIMQYIIDRDHDYNSIFVNGVYPDFKDTGVTGHHNIINTNYLVHGKKINIESGLNTYNSLFHTTYTINDVLENKLIKTMTFMISKGKFEKLMYFLANYFYVRVKINIFEDYDIINAYYFIEALLGMFLSLEVKEGARYIPMSELENL
jgi:hypothetical protein